MTCWAQTASAVMPVRAMAELVRATNSSVLEAGIRPRVLLMTRPAQTGKTASRATGTSLGSWVDALRRRTATSTRIARYVRCQACVVLSADRPCRFGHGCRPGSRRHHEQYHGDGSEQWCHHGG